MYSMVITFFNKSGAMIHQIKCDYDQNLIQSTIGTTHRINIQSENPKHSNKKALIDEESIYEIDVLDENGNTLLPKITEDEFWVKIHSHSPHSSIEIEHTNRPV